MADFEIITTLILLLLSPEQKEIHVITKQSTGIFKIPVF